MKKVVLGSATLLSGVLAIAIIFAGAMSLEWNHNGQFSAIWNISQYGLMPSIYVFVAIAVIGLIVAVWGLFEKKE